MKSLIVKFVRSEKGATAIEYAFLVSLIAMACIAAMGVVGTSLNTKFVSVSAGLN